MSDVAAEVRCLTAEVRTLREEVRALREWTEQRQPPMTQKEFAKAIGRSPWWVCQQCQAGLIRRVKNRIPRSELARFLS